MPMVVAITITGAPTAVKRTDSGRSQVVQPEIPTHDPGRRRAPRTYLAARQSPNNPLRGSSPPSSITGGEKGDTNTTAADPRRVYRHRCGIPAAIDASAILHCCQYIAYSFAFGERFVMTYPMSDPGNEFGCVME